MFELQRQAYRIAEANGFWEGEGDKQAEKLALIHSEVSEVLEAIREGDGPDEELPEFSKVEVELADVLIRVFDFAGAYDYDLQGALMEKMERNRKRTYKHGKVF